MEIRARYTLIGAFTLAVILGVFAFVYWLHNAGGLGDRAISRLVFGPVSGLLPGSPVLFNGIRVGEVTALRSASRQSETGDRHGLDRSEHAGARRYDGRAGIPGPDGRGGRYPDGRLRRCAASAAEWRRNADA